MKIWSFEMSLSQILVVIGLFCELVSALIIVRKVFWSKERRIRSMGKPFSQTVREERKEGIVVLGFLITGVIFQVIAIFV